MSAIACIKNAVSTTDSNSPDPMRDEALHPQHLQGTQMAQDRTQYVLMDSDATERYPKSATVPESRACSLSFAGFHATPDLLKLKQPLVDNFRL